MGRLERIYALCLRIGLLELLLFGETGERDRPDDHLRRHAGAQ